MLLVFLMPSFAEAASMTASFGQSNTTSSLSDQIQRLLDQIAGLRGDAPSAASAVPSITFTRLAGPAATAKYVNLPAKAYVNLLWQSPQGQWLQVGQTRLPRKGGSGTVVVKITGTDPRTGTTPAGSFKLQVQKTDSMSVSAESALFTIEKGGVPTCSLAASTEYPGDVGTRVKLTWASMNADYMTIKTVYSNTAYKAKNSKKHEKPSGTKTVQPDRDVRYYYTFYGEGGTTTCDIHLSYKG